MFLLKREPQYRLNLTYTELRIMMAAMINFRNHILALNGPTEDIDMVIIHDELQNRRIDITAACTHKQAFKRRDAHGRINYFSAFDRRHRGTVP